MKRTFLVVVTVALACLGLTGLRVTVLEHLAAPSAPQVAPRPVEDGEPPPHEPPVEFIAGLPRPGAAERSTDAARGGRAARLEPSALLWGQMPRHRATD